MDPITVLNRWTSGRRVNESMSEFYVRALAAAAEEHVKVLLELEDYKARYRLMSSMCHETADDYDQQADNLLDNASFLGRSGEASPTVRRLRAQANKLRSVGEEE